MKKIMYLAAALLVLVGCNKNSQENKENAPENFGTITGKIELPTGPNKIAAPTGWEDATEDFTMKWENTDAIFIYNQTECQKLTVKSINTETGNAEFEGNLLTDMSNYNVAYGYDPTATGVTEFAVPYIANNYRPFAWGTGKYNIFTIDNFGPVMGLKLQGTAKVDKIEVVASKSSAAQATYTMSFETAIELNATTPTVVYFPLNDLAEADKLEAKFYQGSSLCKIQVFTTLPAKNVVTTYPAIEVNDPYNGHEYVDLGLSVKWATMNVGATSPEGYGDYFAWGETEPYYNTPITDPISWKSGRESGYSWQSYCGNSEFTEWSTVPYDENNVLKPEYDAAYKNWGGNWRMPTKTEQDELREKCTWSWKPLNGINGYEVEGPNKNTIFLPASGCRYEASLGNVGSYSYYWSSSLVEYYSDNAYDLYFSSVREEWYFDFRNYGQSVRPVCE